MGETSIHDIKELYNSVSILMDSVESAVDLSMILPPGQSLKDYSGSSLMIFAFRIITADGVVSNAEAAFVTDVFQDMCVKFGNPGKQTPEDIMQVSKSISGDYSVPPIFPIIKVIDSMQLLGPQSLSLVSAVANIYQIIGEYIVRIDGYVNPKANSAFTKMMNMI